MDYTFLAEKEEMWARMLMEVLEGHGISCVGQPVYGAGLVIKAGMGERLQVYVPRDRYGEAQELMEGLFPEDRA